jgi:hypothetical protein
MATDNTARPSPTEDTQNCSLALPNLQLFVQAGLMRYGSAGSLRGPASTIASPHIGARSDHRRSRALSCNVVSHLQNPKVAGTEIFGNRPLVFCTRV